MRMHLRSKPNLVLLLLWMEIFHLDFELRALQVCNQILSNIKLLFCALTHFSFLFYILFCFLFVSNYFFLREFQYMTSALNDVLYYQTKTPIGFWCKRRLNPRFFIQPSGILLVELTGTYHFNYFLIPFMLSH